MGDYIYSMPSDFRVRHQNQDAALNAIKSLKGSETCNKGRFPNLDSPDHFAFISAQSYLQAGSLLDAMNCWRWDFEEEVSGDLISPSFLGQKLGDEDVLFAAIAPYVEKGSFIQVFSQSSNEIWRWVFSGAGVSREYAQIVFPSQKRSQSFLTRKWSRG